MKVGDKVRVINDILGNAPQFVGMVGVLDEITNDGSFDYVVLHPEGSALSWDRSELEVVDGCCNPKETDCGGMCSGCE